MARAKHATEDRERDRRDEENRRAAKEGLVGVRSLSMFAVGLVVGKRKRTSTDSELDEEGRKKLHVLWVHRGERLFRQYIDRLRRLKAAKTKAAHSRVRGETLPDLVLPDWNFNEIRRQSKKTTYGPLRVVGQPGVRGQRLCRPCERQGQGY